ncbi:MAG: hypothetical protein OEW36_03260, partial [Hylemonella sp.]|nr:hypothetical protein [Hylemonella sp.]
MIKNNNNGQDNPQSNDTHSKTETRTRRALLTGVIASHRKSWAVAALAVAGVLSAAAWAGFASLPAP